MVTETQSFDSYFVMHFLGNPPMNGASTKNDLPHITFLAHLNLPSGDTSLLGNVIQNIVGVKPFTLHIGETKTFGINMDKTVTTFVDRTGDAFELHHNMFNSIPVTFFGQPQYGGENFIPHITTPNASTLVPDVVTVNTLTICKHIGGYGSDVVEIVNTFTLTEA